MATQINKLSNANVYLDGVSRLGLAEEVELPEIKAKYSDHKGLGMIGEIELPNGFEKMTGKIKWSSLYPDVVADTGSPFNIVQMQIRGSLDMYDAGGDLTPVSVVAFLSVRFKHALSKLVLKQNENSEQESEFSATYYRLEVDGAPLVEIDFFANLFFVNDSDELAAYRANLGI